MVVDHSGNAVFRDCTVGPGRGDQGRDVRIITRHNTVIALSNSKAMAWSNTRAVVWGNNSAMARSNGSVGEDMGKPSVSSVACQASGNSLQPQRKANNNKSIRKVNKNFFTLYTMLDGKTNSRATSVYVSYNIENAK